MTVEVPLSILRHSQLVTESSSQPKDHANFSEFKPKGYKQNTRNSYNLCKTQIDLIRTVKQINNHQAITMPGSKQLKMVFQMIIMYRGHSDAGVKTQ